MPGSFSSSLAAAVLIRTRNAALLRATVSEGSSKFEAERGWLAHEQETEAKPSRATTKARRDVSKRSYSKDKQYSVKTL
jgi:hypothetical protein